MIDGSSSSNPMAVLHFEQSNPRIRPVEWQWSTAKDFTFPWIFAVSGLLQMAQTLFCFMERERYPASLNPNLAILVRIVVDLGCLLYHSLHQIRFLSLMSGFSLRLCSDSLQHLRQGVSSPVFVLFLTGQYSEVSGHDFWHLLHVFILKVVSGFVPPIWISKGCNLDFSQRCCFSDKTGS